MVKIPKGSKTQPPSIWDQQIVVRVIFISMLATSPFEFCENKLRGWVFPKENEAGIGVVIRNNQGLVIALCSKKLTQAYSGDEIEALAAAVALSFASEIGVSSAVLEGNLLVLIKALMDKEASMASFGLLVKDVRGKSQSFDQLLYSRTKKEGNLVAHNLVRYVINIPGFLVWIEYVSQQFSFVL